MRSFNLDRIFEQYNPEYDIGGGAPIHWSVYTLAVVIREQQKQISAQEQAIEGLRNQIDNLDQQLNGEKTQ